MFLMEKQAYCITIKSPKTDKYVLWQIKKCGQTKFCLTANINAYHLINIFLPLSVI